MAIAKNSAKIWLTILLIVGSTLHIYVILYFYVQESTGKHLSTQMNTDRCLFSAKHVFVKNNTFEIIGTYKGKNALTVSNDDLQLELSIDMFEKSLHRNMQDTFKNFLVAERKVKEVNCRALLDGDVKEWKWCQRLMKKNLRPSLPPSFYIKDTRHCYIFQLRRGYVMNSLRKEEENFPIAFSILMFKDVEQVERLLRAIYRPQNYYCIHVDKKSDAIIKEVMSSIAHCFNNVFVTSRSVDVRWGKFTVLEPDLICMEELWKYKKWKYFINLTGQEFPLKTNYDLVKILQAYNGSNDVEATVKRANKNRWAKAGPPPHKIRPVKGSDHVVISRGFVDFILHNETAKDFLTWVKKTDVPDETYFSSLNHNPHLGVPGSYSGEPETDSKRKPFIARFKNWGDKIGNWTCQGKRVSGICIFAVGDLPILKTRKEMIANKFHLDFEPFALDCIEEWHYNKTRDEFLGLENFDNSYYKTLDFVKNKV